MGRGKKQIIMDANMKIRYRLALAIAIVAACIGIVWCYLWQLESRLPKSMILYQDRMEQIDLGLPLVGEIKAEPGGFLVSGNLRSEAEAVSFSLDHKISLKADRVGSYQADLKLFGLIPYKKMQVDVIQEQKVMPSGSAVGIYLESQGIMVWEPQRFGAKMDLSIIPRKTFCRRGIICCLSIITRQNPYRK